MNQIFKITVGPETIHGRLPTCRVGRTYSARFHIAGVSPESEPPKVWIDLVGEPAQGGTPTHNTVFWTAVWSAALGVWVVDVSSDASEYAGSLRYAITASGPNGEQEYMIGEGAFVVYDNIAAGGGLSGEGTGTSVAGVLAAINSRMGDIEETLVELTSAIGDLKQGGTNLPMFDPSTAYDMDLRAQVQAITNILRGTP